MHNKKIILFLIPVYFVVIFFLATNDWLLSIVLFLLFEVYVFFYVFKKLSLFGRRTKRINECFSFVSTFIISLSVKTTLAEVFDNIEEKLSISLKEEYQSLKHLEHLEILKGLSSYFSLTTYEMFLNVIDLYLEQGGDILKMASPLLDDIRRMEEMTNECLKISKRKMVEFIGLWFFSTLILVFCRFGIGQFYDQIMATSFYSLLIMIWFVFVGIAFHIALQKYIYLPIVGEIKK